MEQATFLQIIVNGAARFLFEQTHHVKFTDELYKDYFMEDREDGRK